MAAREGEAACVPCHGRKSSDGDFDPCCCFSPGLDTLLSLGSNAWHQPRRSEKERATNRHVPGRGNPVWRQRRRRIHQIRRIGPRESIAVYRPPVSEEQSLREASGCRMPKLRQWRSADSAGCRQTTCLDLTGTPDPYPPATAIPLLHSLLYRGRGQSIQPATRQQGVTRRGLSPFRETSGPLWGGGVESLRRLLRRSVGKMP